MKRMHNSILIVQITGFGLLVVRERGRQGNIIGY